MKQLFRFSTLIVLLFGLAGCAEYYQAETARAEATAAPYVAQVGVAQAERDAQIAALDTQLQIVGIQATAQAEQAGLLVTQTSKSLAILEDASARQVELLEAQYHTMQINAWVLVIAGVLFLAAGLALALWLSLRRRSQPVEVRREIVYLPSPAAPLVTYNPPTAVDVTARMPIITRADYWRAYCDQARADQDREA